MKKEKSEWDKDRIIACIVVFWPIVIAIIDRAIRELS